MDREQDVCLFSRKRLELTGIDEVESLTEEQITLSSALGMIAIDGQGMKMDSFCSETGELKITGEIDGLYYYGKRDKTEKKGAFAKLFK